MAVQDPVRVRLLSWRTLIAAVFFVICTLPACWGALFGAERIVGRMPGRDYASLVEAVDANDASPADITMRPLNIGPGDGFFFSLTMPGGIGGRVMLHEAVLDVDNPQWPTQHLPLHVGQPWGDSVPPKEEVKPVHVELPFFDVPMVDKLAYGEVDATLHITGTRPLLDKEGYLYNDRFQRSYVLHLRLGPGDYRPHGWLNFSIYNDQTWIIAAFVTLGITNWILGTPRLLRRPPPAEVRLPPTARPRK